VAAYCWLGASGNCVGELEAYEPSDACGGAYLPQPSHDGGRNWLGFLEIVKDWRGARGIV